MTFRIPSWWLKTATEEQVREALEFRLSTKDVARLMQTDMATVLRWSKAPRPNQSWLPLKSRRYHGSPAQCYSLHDVRVFAKARDLGALDYGSLPLQLQQDYGLDRRELVE